MRYMPDSFVCICICAGAMSGAHMAKNIHRYCTFESGAPSPPSLLSIRQARFSHARLQAGNRKSDAKYEVRRGCYPRRAGFEARGELASGDGIDGVLRCHGGRTGKRRNGKYPG